MASRRSQAKPADYGRAKSVDYSRASQVRARISIMARSGIERAKLVKHANNFTRYSRKTAMTQKAQSSDFKIRTSVADIIMKELEEYDRCIFYQRVFILTKNVPLTVTAQSSVASILDKYMHSKTNITVDGQVEGESDAEEHDMEVSAVDENEETENTMSQFQPKTENLLLITKKDIETAIKEKRTQELDFFDELKPKIETIVKRCEFEQLSEDRFSGLFLCMGNGYSLFVLEGSEDTITTFCRDLLGISSQYFEHLRVFSVEDRIGETYFDEFVYRRSVAMNINEKFPPPTANDPQLMGSQHWLLKEKLRIFCQTLSYEIKPRVQLPTVEIPMESTVTVVPEEKKSPTRHKPKPKKKKKRRGKSPVTAVAIDASTALGTETSENVNLQGEENEDEDETTAPAPASAPPAEPVDKLLEKVPLTSTTTIPAESNVTKETSVKLQPIPEVMGEEAEQPEEVEEEDFFPMEILKPFAVNPSIYNRLLPEVQRIDLVITSKRFYFDLDQFVPFSEEIPMRPDEDAMIWPTGFTYLPLNVFDRMPFDVNLTFGNYDKKANEEEEDDSSDEEGKEEEKEKKDE